MTDLERQALDEVRDLLAPLTVYTVEKILGMGAAGYVLKVQHRVFGVRALKLVHAGLLRSRTIRERFDTEARIMNLLTHPNVVKVYDLGELAGSPYIVMDFLEGGTLEDHLGEFGKMPSKQAVQVTIAILHGLQAAHDKGVTHRDIKPQNILFDRDGTPKIADFGIARVEEGTRSLTREGSTMGTFAYMAPEQLSGEHSLVDARSDIHAVGVTLYVMLTCGKLGQEAFFRQIEDHPERLAGVSDTLQMVIRMATAQARESRFASAAAMADELEIYLATSLPDDPEGTPALGSVGLRSEPSAVAVDDAQNLPADATLTPWLTRVQEGGSPPASYTIHPALDMDAETAELAAIRLAAKRRFLRWVLALVVAVLALLLIATGAWLTMRPEPIVESELVVQTPVQEAVSVTTAPTPEVIEPPAPSPEPVVQPHKVEPRPVSKTPTSKVVVQTPPEAAVPVEEKASVRLILKADTTATITLSGNGGTFTLTGGSREVPLGTYRVSVDMPGRDAPQVGTLTVTPGLTVVTCDSRFRMCTGLK